MSKKKGPKRNTRLKITRVFPAHVALNIPRRTKSRDTLALYAWDDQAIDVATVLLEMAEDVLGASASASKRHKVI